MRSQIGGLTQGVKNAQDGISMIQTFEGALTETDSILQRMKTLADQAANGTYQDDVDRDAIQLEFDQLNDELNQIADTDYNGVIVLNGGQMADGTVAQEGKFDYTNGYTTTVIAEKATDISGVQKDTIADQSKYTKEIADAVWNAVGADVNKNETLNVTFMYDGTRWMAQTITDTDGNVVKGANAANLEARTVERDDATGKGGFEVIAGKDPYTGKDIVATNAIFDEMQGLKQGDTVTIQFQNSKASTYAPKNIGIDECYDANKPFKSDDATKIDPTDMIGKVSVKLADGIKDSAMNKDVETALKALDAAKFTVAYAAGKATGVTVANPDDTTGIAADVLAAIGKITVTGETITYDDGAGVKFDLGEIKFADITADLAAMPSKVGTPAATFGNGASLTATDSATLLTGLEGKLSAAQKATDTAQATYTFTSGAGATSTWDLTAADGTSLATGISMADMTAVYGFTFGSSANLQAGDKIEVDYTAATSAKNAAKPTATANIDFGINVDAFHFADMSNLTVHAVETPEVATMKHQVAEQQKNGVSQSNAFGQASAPLTYTDHIVLQSGARSKDAVDFTFKYSCGGMGDLKANMNCSAREDGLNTASLSLRTAKDANFAIDRIDNAINKVSMVRGTFGAAQNRLEHKIDNMNVTKENLTSAESRIRDTNIAEEMSNFTRNQILSQAAQSMLAQANSLPQGALQLLG